MSFDTLPAELYDAIFSHISPPELQNTVLAVTRAIPRAPVPLRGLFYSISLRRPEKTIQAYNRLRPRTLITRRASVSADNTNTEVIDFRNPVAWVKELSIETWSVDADVLINLIHLLPNLQSLTIWIGPNNFTPDHLEELFSRPLANLRYLALRFRPYVDKVTYYQFLKGAYFDSTLTTLSRWPSIDLSTLSIVQDPLDPERAQRQDFAQPIVFFRLDLVPLLNSPAVSSTLRYLRIRIPSRPVARVLCGPTSFASPLEFAHTARLPILEFLDLSTCSVMDAEVDTVLARFSTVRHIVLDKCAILRGDLRDGESSSLGKRLALIGVRRAKDREKALKAWLESRAVSENMGSDGAPAVDQARALAVRRAKKGRKGLATATISLRTADAPAASSLSVPTWTRPISQAAKQGLGKIRVLPSLPSTVSISVMLSSAIKQERYPAIREEFREGWKEGVAQLAVTRARLRTSAGNGVRVMSIYATDPDEDDDIEPGSLEEGLYGLVDVDRTDPESYGMPVHEGVSSLSPPVICFAGPGIDGAHEPECGHSLGWTVMKDTL